MKPVRKGFFGVNQLARIYWENDIYRYCARKDFMRTFERSLVVDVSYAFEVED